MPIIEIVLRQLATHGFSEATILNGHLGHLVLDHFATMDQIHRLANDFLSEREPLGTVGPAAHLSSDHDGLPPINTDVLCDVDFAAFADAFRRERPALAAAVHPRLLQIDFAVFEVYAGGDIPGWVEKPLSERLYLVGINIVSPEAAAT